MAQTSRGSISLVYFFFFFLLTQIYFFFCACVYRKLFFLHNLSKLSGSCFASELDIYQMEKGRFCLLFENVNNLCIFFSDREHFTGVFFLEDRFC